MRWIYVSSLIFTVYVAIAAQSDSVRSSSVTAPKLARFQRLTAEDGLPISGVSSLLQDSRGFIWVGSFNGLSRFDGYRFVDYASDPQNPNSISSVSVTAICETRSGVIWIGTSNGLNRYEERTDSFTAFNFDPANPAGIPDGRVTTIYEDGRGVLWIGTNSGGLTRFNADSQSFTSYKFPSPRSNTVFDLAEDRHGEFWVGTNEGVYKFDRETGIAESIASIPDVPAVLTDSAVSSIVSDQAGAIWLGIRKGV